jgi:hypothetical protein
MTDIQTEPEGEPPEEDDIEDVGGEKPEAAATPKPLRTYGSRTNGSSLEVSSSSTTNKTQQSAVNGSGSIPTKKRPRPDDEDEDDVMEKESVDKQYLDAEDISSSEHRATQETDVGELIISRKRVRH